MPKQLGETGMARQNAADALLHRESENGAPMLKCGIVRAITAITERGKSCYV